jgi:hypothetical protein
MTHMAPRTLAIAAAFTMLTPLAFAQSNLPGRVESSQLSELDGWSVSALSRNDGALAPDLWARSDPAFVSAVFARLPANYESPAVQTLARRVLFSGGEAPRGATVEHVRGRFEALGKMGAADELATLAAGSGSTLNDPAVAMFAAQAELARGRRAEACQRGRGANAGETPPPFLLRLRAYCAAVTGDRAAADLALELARAQNAADNWYTGAVAAAAGAPGARPPAANYDNSLSTQLSVAGRLRPAANALNNSSTLALVALARNENAPQPQRTQAAAIAFRRGAISAQETRAIFGEIPADATTGLPAIAQAVRSGSVGIAPHDPAASPNAPPPSISVEGAGVLAGILRAATSPADFAAAARFFRQEINSSQQAPDPAAAVLFARAAITNGDVQVAQRLIASARQAGAEEAALAPLDAALVALAGPRGEQGGMALQRRIDAGAAQPRAAARDAVILAALGAPVNGGAQAFVFANAPQGGARADSGAMLALAAAVERGATGEGALLAVVAAGEGGPARLDAESLERIIRALRGLRLEEDARRIAAEAILAGPPR